MTAPTPLREFSLFSGAGIGALAAQEAGIETVAFCESDEWCQYALAGLWPGVPVFPDVAALTADALPGGIDIISGGFPCQDISSAGKGVGITGERSGLWFEMLRLVREVRPAWVLAENVPALRTRGADVVVAGLEEAGYTVWPVVVGAWCCGAPHRRNRVWIVASRIEQPGERRTHEQERGQEGRVAVERAGEAMGHSDANGARVESERALRNGERIGACAAGGREDEQHGADGAGADVADGEGRESWEQGAGDRGEGACGGGKVVPHSPLLGCGPRRPESGGLSGPWRWPLGPGAEQHEWEYPRVCNASLRTMGSAGQPWEAEPDGPTQPPLGRPTDGLAGSLPPAVRRAALRALGNAWIPQVPYLIYRWIVQQEAAS